ncbi:MAG: GNAT family N-acetyltransferase [Ideonella sp. MAG2]|nr:MAG: GNAT family N-acetyltransferase [Ideonella sp. MAG2]
MAAGFRFEAYSAAHRERWNALVARSPNATFLFDRGFMDYHANRFIDASLLVWRGEQLLALLPAHADGDQRISHGGLSYGGLVLAQPLGAATMLALMQALQADLAEQGVRRLLYKTVPSIYHQWPCEEDRYALFRCHAELVRREVLSVIGPSPAHWPMARRRAISTALRRRGGLRLSVVQGGESPDALAAFWALLSAELASRHRSTPVHSVQEMALLAGRFPRQIQLRLAWQGDAIVAGMVVFQTATVLHVQYMAANAEARRCAALDQLVEQAIEQAQAQGLWFDFGHSNESAGQVLNEGLCFYKESFGASTVVHDHYVLNC